MRTNRIIPKKNWGIVFKNIIALLHMIKSQMFVPTQPPPSSPPFHSALDWAHIPQSDDNLHSTWLEDRLEDKLRSQRRDVGQISDSEKSCLPLSINQWTYIAHLHRCAQPCLKRLTGVTLIVCQSLLHKDAHHVSSQSMIDIWDFKIVE